jgi:V/A-type H+-transporting ATPase subunit C
MTYVVLRAHARISGLLTEEQMQTLADTRDVDEFLTKLIDTPYGRITLEDKSRPDISLERIFYQKFIERIEKIVELTPKKIGDFLMGYYQMRFEVVNLKRILRGKFSNATEDEIRLSLIPISAYQVASYEDLVKADNLESVVESLRGTPYARISEQMDLYEEHDALWPLELMLNYLNDTVILKAVEKLPTKNRLIVRKLVELETDIENVLIAIKQRGTKGKTLNIDELFPATYNIKVSHLNDIIEAENIRPVIQDLGSPYAEILGPIYEGDVALIRTYLRRVKYDHVTASKLSDEYGFNVIMAYLVYSEIEKDNLVGLAWGKTQGLMPKELLKYVVIPRG